MGTLNFEPLHPGFGAWVKEVDLTSDYSDTVLEEIREAIDTYSLLCFPDQDMNDAAHAHP